MKCKYESMDVRTGSSVGVIVELSDEELNVLPYNVFMRKLVSDEEFEAKMKFQIAKAEFDALRELLYRKGLSLKRTERVLELFKSEKELRAGFESADLDVLTKRFLQSNFGTVVENDLNRDGVFDGKDVSLAGKVLAKNKKK